jgi:hypothetical protein
MVAESASSGASPGRMMSQTQARLFCNSFGHEVATLWSAPGQRMDFSAESTPACATDDFPTPDAPIRIGQRPGFNAGLADPKIKARLADLGGIALTGSPSVRPGMPCRRCIIYASTLRLAA